MAKSIKLENDTYLDSAGVMHKRKSIDNYFHGNIITDGNPVKCGYKVDNKDVYVKRINCGALPNTTRKIVAHGISNPNILWIQGICFDGTYNSPIPYISQGSFGPMNQNSIAMFATQTDIYIETARTSSQFNAWITIWFTYN